MLSQIALVPDLPNPFRLFDLSESDVRAPSQGLKSEIKELFETNHILIFEGFRPENFDYFLYKPPSIFRDWVPPVFDHEILEDIHPGHQLLKFYDENEVLEFQKMIGPFQKSFEEFHDRLFEGYSTVRRMWSWRMNKMELGYLHLDVPDNYEEHQMRTFINLGRRARVLEFGPSFESLVKKEYEKSKLFEFNDLDNHNYFQAIKERVFKAREYDEFHLPRHYLRLAPGAFWVSHSSMMTHGLVFGEKTVCYETRIPAADLIYPENHFNKVVARAKQNKHTSAYDYTLLEIKNH